MRVTITDPELKLRIADLRELGRRPRSNLLDNDDVRGAFEDVSKRRFAKGIRADSKGWKIRKQELGLSPRPMIATGTAFMALTRRSGPGRTSVIFKSTPAGVTFGVRPGASKLFYVRINAKKHGNTPARRVVAVDKTAREFIARRAVDGLTRNLL